jgi:hypothetical protein
VIGRLGLTLIGRASQSVCGAANATAAAVQDVRVDHRRANILVTQQFLNGAVIIPVGQ